MEPSNTYQKFPTGKSIIISYAADGSISTEQHGYGVSDIEVTRWFDSGKIADETYFAKGRIVSRRAYERERLAYPDMPPASDGIEDTGADLMRAARAQAKQNKLEAQHRFEASSAGRFPRPDSTNWIRVTAHEKSHLMIFASRDWKLLGRETALPSGRRWLSTFGFNGPPGEGGRVSKGLEVGFEVAGDRETLLTISIKLLDEAKSFDQNPSQVMASVSRIGRGSTHKKWAQSAWISILPPLIAFLSELADPTVMIFNHHR